MAGQMYGSAGQGWSSAGSYSGLFGSLIGGAWNMGLAAYNANKAKELAQYDRQQNFKFGEAAADSADARTRALYRDLYSPSAMLKQYQEAGMSPSMMYGGMPGAGGSSGASAAGAASGTTPFVPMSMLEGAQMANIIAQTMKTKAETKNIEKDTDIKKLQEEMSQMTTTQYKTEFDILNKHYNRNGKETSLYELAGENYSFEGFLQDLREASDHEINSEQEIKVLRSIYEARSRFSRDIMTLSNETVSAKFQLDVTTALNNENYAKLNAEAAIAQLRALKSTSELTDSQKEAWNNLLDRLGKKGSTTRDIIIVIGMMLSQYSSKIKINTGK